MGANNSEIETLNMLNVNVETFCRLIKEDLEDEIYDPIIGLGKSGVGKTMSISDLAKEMGIGYCELRLVNLTETDMLGIPVEKDGRTTYASNDLLPNEKRDGEIGLLVLDEITSASHTIRAAAYQLMDSKRSLGNYKLGKKWKIVALGNGPDDGGVFTGMEHASLSRGMCYRIEPDLECWKRWAVKNSINPAVIAYVTWEPQNLHNFDPDTLGQVFPCPRSWEALSKRLNSREKRNGGPLSERDVTLYASGAIGAQLAPSFAAFYKYSQETINPGDIIKGKASADISNTNPEIVYITIQKISKMLQDMSKGYEPDDEMEHPLLDATINVFKWIIGISKYRKDYAVMALQDIGTNVKQVSVMVMCDDRFDERLPEFLKFAKDNDIIFNV